MFKPKSKIVITGTMLLTVLFFLAVALHIEQREEELNAICRCESEGMLYVTLALREYAQQRSGQLPSTSKEAVVWAAKVNDRTWGHLPIRCNQGKFVYSGCRAKTAAEGATPIVWCESPHGFYSKWRNVIFSDLSFRRAPESVFASFMRGEKIGSITQFEVIDDIQQNGS